MVKKKETGSEPTNPETPIKAKKSLMIPKHRFDEVSNELKEIKAWRKEQEEKAQKTEEEQLKGQKKFEELANKFEERAKKAEEALIGEKIDNKILAEAQKAGIKDTEVALKLIDRSKIEEKDGEINGIAEAVEGLVEAKPYLKDAEPASLGSGTNPPDSSSKPTVTKFRLSQIQDSDFYKKHEVEITKAMTIPGAIVDDMGISQQQPTGSPPSTSGTSSGE